MPPWLVGARGACLLDAHANRQPVFARHEDPELRREARVEGDEVLAQRGAPLRVEARGQRSSQTEPVENVSQAASALGSR